MTARQKLIAFAILCVVCVGGAVAYAVNADQRTSADPAGGSAGTSGRDGGSDGTGGTDAEAAIALTTQPHVLFRSTTVDSTFGAVGVLGLDALDATPAWTGLTCERVDFANGRGMCLTANRGLISTYSVVIFDGRFQPVFTKAVAGLPSRDRVSPDGRYGATTTFVTGDSYASDNFSTRTELFDLQSGASLGDLEQFTVRKDGTVIDAVDHNFWGVTFAQDSNRFYATLGTGGHTYLVEGDVAAREMNVLRDGVECPSLSPDGTRIAFKKREGTDAAGRIEWRLSVLDLANVDDDHPLAEEGNVDDQAEWLDDSHVLYSIPQASSGTPTKNTWMVPADGSGAPTEFLPGAYSTTVVRN